MRSIFQGMLNQHSSDLPKGDRKTVQNIIQQLINTRPKIHVWSMAFEPQTFHVKGQTLELSRGSRKHLILHQMVPGPHRGGSFQKIKWL